MYTYLYQTTPKNIEELPLILTHCSIQLLAINYCYKVLHPLNIQKKSPGGLSVNNLFLKISQNSQKNTCARILYFMIKLQASDAGAFLRILRDFLEYLFHRTPLVAALNIIAKLSILDVCRSQLRCQKTSNNAFNGSFQ